MSKPKKKERPPQWRDDLGFVAKAQKLYPKDVAAKGKLQANDRMKFRYQGYLLRDVVDPIGCETGEPI